ncbi:MAG: cytochrome c5 family protein [Burkholderiales bacterium]|nr:cytochrome c5 family protein [Burkholderiales bacterium]
MTAKPGGLPPPGMVNTVCGVPSVPSSSLSGRFCQRLFISRSRCMRRGSLAAAIGWYSRGMRCAFSQPAAMKASNSIPAGHFMQGLEHRPGGQTLPKRKKTAISHSGTREPGGHQIQWWRALTPRHGPCIGHPRDQPLLEIREMTMIAKGLVALMTMGVAGVAMAADGKAVYEKACVACHATGVANAPKLGDKAAWAPRIGQGKATLVATVKTGKGAMPPKAGNAALTDDEISAAVDFLLAAAK